MKKNIIFLWFLFLAHAAIAQPPAGDANVGDTYGGPFQKGKVLTPRQLTTRLQDGKIAGNFRGKVLEVCAKKGCWMKLEIANDRVATIKMKDYAFFVPLAVTGKQVEIQGVAEVKTTSVAELQHFAEDAGKSKQEIAAIQKPKEEIHILANSIRVVEK